MPTQNDPWYVAIWSSTSWGGVSESYPYLDQAKNWLANTKSHEAIVHSEVKTFPNFRTAQYYRKHGGYPHQ